MSGERLHISRRQFTAGVMGVLATGALSACGSSESGENTFTYEDYLATEEASAQEGPYTEEYIQSIEINDSMYSGVPGTNPERFIGSGRDQALEDAAISLDEDLASAVIQRLTMLARLGWSKSNLLEALDQGVNLGEFKDPSQTLDYEDYVQGLLDEVTGRVFNESHVSKTGSRESESLKKFLLKFSGDFDYILERNQWVGGDTAPVFSFKSIEHNVLEESAGRENNLLINFSFKTPAITMDHQQFLFEGYVFVGADRGDNGKYIIDLRNFYVEDAIVVDE